MPRYRVSGPLPFLGNEPGKTFEADTDPVIERAIARGSVTEVKQRSKVEDAPSAPKPSGGAGDEKEKE